MRVRGIFVVIAFMLAGCSPEVQEFVQNPPDMQPGGEGIYAADGVRLPHRQWLPRQKRLRAHPKAVVLALHGFNDYSKAFEGAGDYLSGRGIAVYAYDQRGFGEGPQPGIWAGEQNLLRDVAQALKVLQARYPGTPLYLMGESMGGAVAIAAASQPDFPEVEGVVLVAPAVWGSDAMNPVFRGTLWLAAHTMPYKRFTGSDLKVIASSNFPMLRAMAADPLVIKKTRVDAVYGVVGMMGSAYDRVPFVKAPVLLLYGAQDQVIPPSPVEEALARFPQQVTYAYYPAGFHMLLRDLQAKRVLEDVAAWIEDPEAELPSGFGVQHAPSDAVEFEPHPMPPLGLRPRPALAAQPLKN